MKYSPNSFYHIYNRGNNRQLIFFQRRNYQFFMRKLKKEVAPHCHILAYCLMPNHYHLMIYIDQEPEMTSSGAMQIVIRKLGTLQSSYTQAINKQEKRTGSLFQPKFKSIAMSSSHAFNCFHYIHQNPMKAGLVRSMDAWEFSSYREYITGVSPLCNRELTSQYLDIPSSKKHFEELTRGVVLDEKILKTILSD